MERLVVYEKTVLFPGGRVDYGKLDLVIAV